MLTTAATRTVITDLRVALAHAANTTNPESRHHQLHRLRTLTADYRRAVDTFPTRWFLPRETRAWFHTQLNDIARLTHTLATTGHLIPPPDAGHTATP